MRVPVTTVPKPDTVKERSTARRGRPRSGRGAVSARMTSIFWRSWSRPWPVVAGEGDDFGVFQDGPFEGFDGLHFGEFEKVVVNEVGLGEGDETPSDVEEVEDGEVLAGLGHDAFVGGDNEEGHVDAADAGEHIADEALVAGNVDDGDFLAGREGEPGEAEVDGHAPFLLLGEPIGVDAREGLDEGGLAVVHVARGADDVHGCFLGMECRKDSRVGG